MWRYEIEVRNLGGAPINKLTATFTLYDQAGQAIGSTGSTGIVGRKFVVPSWQPPLLPKGLRGFTSMPVLNKAERARYDRACVRVTAIE